MQAANHQPAPVRSPGNPWVPVAITLGLTALTAAMSAGLIYGIHHYSAESASNVAEVLTSIFTFLLLIVGTATLSCSLLFALSVAKVHGYRPSWFWGDVTAGTDGRSPAAGT